MSAFSSGTRQNTDILMGLQQSQESNDSSMDVEQLQQVFEQFNHWSKGFLDSYQSLEGKVECLADRLSAEVANKEIQLSEKERLAKRLQSILSILPVGVIVLDQKGVIQDSNAVAVDLLGRPLLGERWVDIIKRSFSPRDDDGCEVSLKDGRRVRIDTRSLEYETGQLVVITDLTETRKMQDRLNQQHRLSSMGKMMAFLAHQIRTPLSSALLYASHFKDKQLDQATQQKFANRLVDCLQHMELHINDMLHFVRSGGLQKSNISIEKFIQELEIHLVSNLHHWPIRSNIQSQFLLNLNLDIVLSAVTNLVENSIQATRHLDKPKISIDIREQKKFCLITVSDNGCGIESDNLKKAIEPFYTTKSNGTGLGLAVVQGVMRTHLGDVRISSKVNEGTRISMIFPKAVNEIKNNNDQQQREQNIEPSKGKYYG